jgi:hypothetical protein
MRKLLRDSLVWYLALAAPSVMLAQNTAAKDAVYYPAASALQTETDEYTRYELLSPGTASYRMNGDELVFDRSLGQPRNVVVLPSCWYCTGSAVPPPERTRKPVDLPCLIRR